MGCAAVRLLGVVGVVGRRAARLRARRGPSSPYETLLVSLASPRHVARAPDTWLAPSASRVSPEHKCPPGMLARVYIQVQFIQPRAGYAPHPKRE